MRGSATLEAEVTNISRHGFWILLADREVFLSFEEFPWFKGASVDAILSSLSNITSIGLIWTLI